MVPHFRRQKSILSLIAIVSAALLVAPYLVHSPKAVTDSQITPHLVQTVDLSTTAAGISLLGAEEDDHLSGDGVPGSFTAFPRAHAVVTGDFNNDGFDDVAVGAPDADFDPATGDPRANAGALYIIFGQAVFPSPFIVDANLAAQNLPDTRIFGAAANDNLGFAVASGDVNGDGIDDLLIGAPGADFDDGMTPRDDTGAVFVILGNANFPTGTLDLAVAGTADLSIFGQRTGDEFGSAIATGNAGGPNAIADILIGAPRNTGPDTMREDGGAGYVIFGAATLGTPDTIDIATTPAPVTVFGLAGSLLGSSLAIGDVNGIGPADLLIGAPLSDRPAPTTATETGALFVFAGGVNLNPIAPATTRIFDLDSAVGSGQRPTILIYGSDAEDHLGASVDTGDVNSDGNADILIGAPDADSRLGAPATEDAGEAYVIAGGAALDPPVGQTERRIDVSVTSVNLTIYGASAGDHFGSTVRAVTIGTNGNTDNITDLAVGSPGFNAGGGRDNAGAVHVFYGGPTLLFFAERDLGLQQDDFRLVGQATGDELGWAIAAGDLDNNLSGDLIAGAPFHNVQVQATTRDDAGRVYALLASTPPIPPVNQPPVVAVTAPNGGEMVQGGANFQITWTATDPNGDETIQRFEIRLSTNGGLSFDTIITSNVAGDARMFEWAVPIGLNTTMARIRVVAFDDQNAQGQDDSNGNFTIGDIGVTVTLTAPNGGESLRFGQMFDITWTVPDAVADQIIGFDLFLSTDGGTNFNTPIAFTSPTIPALGAAVRAFEWTVPSICTTMARVAVVARIQGGATTLDGSNANFEIQDNGPTIDTSNMRINVGGNILTLRTVAPPGGAEILFAVGANLEVSTDEAGTAFATFRKIKRPATGRKLAGKGPLNGGPVIANFFPDQAIRLLRITNPPCSTTILRVQRQGRNLVVVP